MISRLQRANLFFSFVFGVLFLVLAKPITAQSPLTTLAAYTSPSGIPYRYVQIEDAERTAIQVLWRYQQKIEDMSPAAMNLWAQTILFGGGGGMDRDEIFETFQDLDARANLIPTLDGINGFLDGPTEELEEIARQVNAILLAPDFSDAELERQKTQLRSSISERETNVWFHVDNLWQNVILSGDPSRRFLAALSLEDVENVSREDLRAFHAQAFTMDQILVSGAGSATPEAFGNAIDLAMVGFSKVPAIRYQAPDFSDRFVFERPIVLHKPNIEKTLIMANGPLPPTTVDFNAALNLGVGVLGFGEQSRLFKAVRGELRAAYGFSGWQAVLSTDLRFLSMGGEIEPKDVPVVLSTVRDTYEAYRDKGIGLVEFPIAKRIMKQRFASIDKDPASLSGLMLNGQKSGQSIAFSAASHDRINNLSRKGVNALVADTLPSFDKTVVMVVSPDDTVLPDACVIKQVEQWRSCLP